MNRKKEHWEEIPLYAKAIEILDIVKHITKIIDDTPIKEFNDEMILTYAQFMMENALIIPGKIAGVSDEDMLYDINMENAAIIRKAAKEILTNMIGIYMCGFKESDYLQLLHNEIEAFRILFAEWVKTFDEWNYVIDRWGLFNPPGINYDDHNPDEDLPFNAEDYLDDI